MVSSAQQSIERQATTILERLETGTHRAYIGEPVSQLEHGLQCAELANRAGASEHIILAALLHDVGHLIHDDGPSMAGLGAIDHEGIGANWLLKLGLNSTIAHLVRHHVSAKRYLCHRYPKYLARLSDASRGTLDWQGGAMSAREANAFETDAHFESLLQLRTFDERAKEPGATVTPLAEYKPMLCRHLTVSGPGIGDPRA
ncbi:MAG: HD domain-containing protein [Myxococcota bacterium]|nr:HD domain-containing protein [Myxococcota bacterium]